LSGGKVIVNQKTWYAHLFRTSGDFTFPYPQSGNQVQAAKKQVKELFFDNKWEGQIYPLSWLVERFWPVPGWSEEQLEQLKSWPLQRDLSKGAIYYTDNEAPENIAQNVRDQILKGIDNVVSCSLKPIEFGHNVVLPLERGYLTMAKQILAALEALNTDIVYFTEHDVLYHPSHFQFIPSNKDKYYYNTNVWKVRASDGHAMRVDDCRQLSGLVCFRETAVKHYRRRVELIEQNGFSRKMGFEPGTHNRAERVDDLKSEKFESEFPNIDIRHDKNLTNSRWSPNEFRDKRYTKGWQESTVENINGWNDFNVIMK
jgi:hypothetical protein